MRITLTPVVVLLAYAAIGCGDSRDRDLRSRGDEIVAKVEQFRRDSMRLPSSLATIGITETETGPVHYDRRSDTSYVVWFGTTLGESVIWDSNTRRWNPPR